MDKNATHQCFVECFVIDDESHDVLLSFNRHRKDGLMGGLVDYIDNTVQDPIYSAIATTQDYINRLIPPSEWILLGTHNTSSSTTTLFATTWDLARLPASANQVLRVPLSQINDHPLVSDYVKEILGSFAKTDPTLC